MVIAQPVSTNKEYIKKYSLFLNDLWIQFKTIDSYILAFIHRSVVNERPDFAPEHNERLEFLWDAVLELIITHKLFNDFPKKPEGELTDIRSALVRWRNLAIISKELWLDWYLILWKWEKLSWWSTNNYILANTLEAFIGAIYLDLWYRDVELFILKHVYSTLDNILEKKLFKDAKSSIQEYVQAEFEVTPSYKVLKEEWPDHSKVFSVWVYMNDRLLGSWEWSSKKKAEENAAEDAYTKLTQK